MAWSPEWPRPRSRSRFQILVEERDAALPRIFGRVLALGLWPIIREERVRRARIEHELDVVVAFRAERLLEGLHVRDGNTGIRLAVESQDRHPDLVGHGERVDAGSVRIGALDVAVPRHGGGDVGIFRREVED